MGKIIEADPNNINLGIFGKSGEGKSYHFEHKILRAGKIKKCCLLLDPKNQYFDIPGFKTFTIKTKMENEIMRYKTILLEIKAKQDKQRDYNIKKGLHLRR